MRRLFLALCVLAAPAVAADPPADRNTAAEVDNAKDAFDFIHQGEYEGALGAGEKAGVQVVSQGNNQYAGKLWRGGLPGAGARQAKPDYEFAGRRAGDALALGAAALTATGAGGALSVRATGDRPAAGEFKKVTRKSPTLGAKPPAGAVVLFAKAGDEANWAGGKVVKLSDGDFLGAGCKSNARFGAFTAHVEFRTPWMPAARGQGRGNSGVYLQDRYEVQVLDSFGLKGENNEAGGVYTLHGPTVNMCLPPLAWQTYDVTFAPATFDAGGKKAANARLTLKHNGVTVHDDVELTKSTGGGQPEGPAPGPFQLQDHGDPVVFRNVWVVPGQ